MKALIALSLLVLLNGCASQGKTDQQIFNEAASAHVLTLPAGQSTVSFPSVKIRSHGVLADNLAIAAGGGADTEQLRQQLHKAKADGESGFLIIGAGSALDVAVLSNAFADLDLQGLRVYYAGGEAQKEQARGVIEKAHGQFSFISMQ